MKKVDYELILDDVPLGKTNSCDTMLFVRRMPGPLLPGTGLRAGLQHIAPTGHSGRDGDESSAEMRENVIARR